MNNILGVWLEVRYKELDRNSGLWNSKKEVSDCYRGFMTNHRWNVRTWY